MESVTALQSLVDGDQEVTDITGKIQETSTTLGYCAKDLAEDGEYATENLLANIKDREETLKRSLEIV